MLEVCHRAHHSGKGREEQNRAKGPSMKRVGVSTSSNDEDDQERGRERV